MRLHKHWVTQCLCKPLPYPVYRQVGPICDAFNQTSTAPADKQTIEAKDDDSCPYALLEATSLAEGGDYIVLAMSTPGRTRLVLGTINR